MTDPQRAIARKDDETSLTPSKVRSGLIARGRKDAEMLAVLAEAESELAPESEIKRLSYLYVSDEGRSLEDVRQEAENGDAKSQFLVADKPGLHNVEPVTWFRKAAEQGYAPAQFTLGARYDGDVFAVIRGEPQDAVQAVYWYRKAAERGLNEAAFNLGSMHANGDGVRQDFAEAATWYRKAADRGLKEAQYNLGLMYANGRGVPQDNAEAVIWYRKAAEQGLEEACFNLGVSYDTGKGVSKGSAEAAKWYLEAAERSYNCKAAFNIGLKYENGQGVVQDYIQAYKWLHFATYDADGDAARNRYAAVRDRVAAKLSLTQVVEALRLAEEYSIENRDIAEGIYDYAEAERLYRQAAEQGNAFAQCQLGDICSSSKNYNWFPRMSQDYAEGAMWYRKAADQGHAQAQFNLGLAYGKGEGVPQDCVQAHMWFNLSASKATGDEQRYAFDAREEIARKMTPQQIAEAQRLAREWKRTRDEVKP